MFDQLGRRMRRRQGIERNPIYRLADDVAAGRMPAEAAYQAVEHPRVLGRLADGDLWSLDQEAEGCARADPQRALILARLTILASRYKGFDRVLVDCNLRAADLLNRMGDEREQELHLREALHAAERIANVNGQRRALARLARLAFDRGETDRARDLLNRQLEAGREDIDTLEDVETAVLLGDLARSGGDATSAREFYHRAGRSARRVGHFEGVVDALLRQIVIVREQGDSAAALLLLQQAQDAAGRTVDTKLQAEIAIQAGAVLAEQGQYGPARAQLARALEQARANDDLVVQGRCLTGLARVEQRGGRLTEAAGHLQELGELEGRLGNRSAAVRALLDASEIYLQLHDPHTAESMLRAAMPTAEELPDTTLRGRALGLCGLCCGALDRRGDALEYLLAAIEQARETGSTAEEASWLLGVAEVLLGFREFDDAQGAARRAGDLASQSGDLHLTAQSLATLGSISLARGLYRDAEDSLLRALAISRELDDVQEQLGYLQVLAQAARRSGQTPGAVRYLHQALDVASGGSVPETRSRLHGQLARLQLSLNQLDDAAEHYQSALEAAEEAESANLSARALRGLAMTLDAKGDPAAPDYYRRAAELYEEIGDRQVAAALRYNLAALLADRGALEDADQQVGHSLELAQAIGDYPTADAARELLRWVRARCDSAQEIPSEDLLLDEFSMSQDLRGR